MNASKNDFLLSISKFEAGTIFGWFFNSETFFDAKPVICPSKSIFILGKLSFSSKQMSICWFEAIGSNFWSLFILNSGENPQIPEKCVKITEFVKKKQISSNNSSNYKPLCIKLHNYIEKIYTQGFFNILIRFRDLFFLTWFFYVVKSR